jgi:hypothetical protein
MHGAMKLGKRAPRLDPRTLRLAKYMGALPSAPSHCDVAPGRSWPMFANDRLSDCTCAAVGHQIEAWGGHTPSELDVVRMYEAVSGYTPSDSSTDRGAVELDVLRYWRKTGIEGDRITAFGAVDVHDHTHVKQACWLFGGLYIGLALPLTAQSQDVWHCAGLSSAAAQPGSWGGHAVNVVGYSRTRVTVVTWGQVKQMTWGFWSRYCDEAYAVLSTDWKSPEGFDLAALEADLAAITT